MTFREEMEERASKVINCTMQVRVFKDLTEEDHTYLKTKFPMEYKRAFPND